MRLLSAAFGMCMILQSADAQTVSLRNVSYPYTAIEVGTTVEVKITGAAPNGTVTVVQNGAPPFTFGTTDAFGYWSVTATEGPENVGSFTQTWYVNGIPMTPDNPNNIWLPYAPRLPDFQVHANYTGPSCPGGPGQSTAPTAGCGAPNNARHWNWSPVTYKEISSVDSSAVTVPAGNWNGIQSKLQLYNASNALDIWVYDSSEPPLHADTLSYGGDCDSDCYNRVDQCTGLCFNAAAVNYVDIRLDIAHMNTAAEEHLDTTLAAFAPTVVAHELGHALRLGEVVPTHGKCSEVQSIMYGSASVLWGCGVTGPTACDTSGINSVYPSAVPYCTPGGNYCLNPGPTCS